MDSTNRESQWRNRMTKKNKQTEILQLESKKTEMKNEEKGLNSRVQI